MNKLKKYSMLEAIELFYFKIRTFLLYKQTRIIRFPFKIRGKKYIKIEEGFTAGYNCRVDALNVYNKNGFFNRVW